MTDKDLAESVIDVANFLEKEDHLTLTATVLRQAAKRLMEEHKKNENNNNNATHNQ